MLKVISGSPSGLHHQQASQKNTGDQKAGPGLCKSGPQACSYSIQGKENRQKDPLEIIQFPDFLFFLCFFSPKNPEHSVSSHSKENQGSGDQGNGFWKKLFYNEM